MQVKSVHFFPVPIALRIRCRATVEQQRMMYLAGRQAREDALAEQYHEEQLARRVPDDAISNMLGWMGLFSLGLGVRAWPEQRPALAESIDQCP